MNLLQPQGTPNISMAGEREGSRVGGGRWQGLRAPREPGEGRGKSGSLHGSGRPVRIYKPEGSWTSRWFIFRAQESLRSDCQTTVSLALPEWMFGSVWTGVKSLNMVYGGHHGMEEHSLCCASCGFHFYSQCLLLAHLPSARPLIHLMKSLPSFNKYLPRAPLSP